MLELGLALVTAGVVVLLFVVYELVGTNLSEEHSQARLARQFNAVVSPAPARAGPAQPQGRPNGTGPSKAKGPSKAEGPVQGRRGSSKVRGSSKTVTGPSKVRPAKARPATDVPARTEGRWDHPSLAPTRRRP